MPVCVAQHFPRFSAAPDKDADGVDEADKQRLGRRWMIYSSEPTRPCARTVRVLGAKRGEEQSVAAVGNRPRLSVPSDGHSRRPSRGVLARGEEATGWALQIVGGARARLLTLA